MELAQSSFVVGILAASLGGIALGQQITRVSVSTNGEQTDQGCTGPEVSADGRFVAFVSSASTLVPADTNGATDVFVRDRVLGTTTRVSVSSEGVEGNGPSGGASITADGRLVAFTSYARNLVAGDHNGHRDVFLHDREKRLTSRISVDSNGAQVLEPSEVVRISADGRFVALASAAALVPEDTNGTTDIYVRELATGAVARVSIDSAGKEVHGVSDYPSISADGRFIAFHSDAVEFVSGDTWGYDDVFVHDRATGSITHVSVGLGHGHQGYGYSSHAKISADGRHVVFTSDAPNIVPGDDNGTTDVFVRDLDSGTTELATVSSTGTQANGPSYGSGISASGRFVTFHSLADNLVPLDANVDYDVFLHDVRTGETSLISVGAAGVQGSGSNYQPAMSDDGRFVAFRSTSTNFVPDDTNDHSDIYVRDLGSPQAAAFCAGDGSLGACPCSNEGSWGQGCDNSSGTGGAALVDFRTASLGSDSLVLVSAGEKPNATTIFLQGDAEATPVASGYGLRCAAGHLERLFVATASPGGIASAPGAGGPTISARSAALGDPIAGGTTRYYQAIYRDAGSMGCPPVGGVRWNLSSGLAVVWEL